MREEHRLEAESLLEEENVMANEKFCRFLST